MTWYQILAIPSRAELRLAKGKAAQDGDQLCCSTRPKLKGGAHQSASSSFAVQSKSGGGEEKSVSLTCSREKSDLLPCQTWPSFVNIRNGGQKCKSFDM